MQILRAICVRTVFVLLASLTASISHCRSADKVETRLEASRAKFAVEIKKLDDQVAKEFEKRVAKARNAGDKSSLDLLVAEQKQFDTKHNLPSWVPTDNILLRISRREMLIESYDSGIRSYVKDVNDSAANRLTKDREALNANPYVMMTWLHQAGEGKCQIKLLSNMTSETTDRLAIPGKSTWTLNRNVLTLRWAHPKAPDGVFIDTVTVSRDGMTYIGTNQLRNVKITGRRMPTTE